MENIQRYQAAVKKYGLPEEEIFQTADLFERRNVAQVALSLFALARLVSEMYNNLMNSHSIWFRIFSDTKTSRVQWT